MRHDGDIQRSEIHLGAIHLLIKAQLTQRDLGLLYFLQGDTFLLPVRLEVACENPRALGLYLASGFRITSTYDYYALDLPTPSVASS
ncbi:MAG: hypothetical protein GX620_13240 [Chloroflexi bacterium]|nr:hypothetical protein [Chloroflexota bacterium]